jgi:hypothetical protein
MGSIVFQIEFHDGRKFRIFCANQNQQNVLIRNFHKINDLVKEITEITSGVHTVNQFLEISESFNIPKIKDWYLKEYPTDDMGEELSPNITFEGLFNYLNKDNGRYDVYDFLEVGDSVIRERCFEKLAEIKNKPYDYIYDLWLGPITKN